MLFDIGSGRYTAPPRNDDANARSAWQADLRKVREESAAAEMQCVAARDSDTTHTEVQGWLRDLGKALGFDVHFGLVAVWKVGDEPNVTSGASLFAVRVFKDVA